MNGNAPPSRPKSKRQRMRLRVTGTDGSAKGMPVSKQVGVFVLLIWVIVPVFVFALAWIFGGILARVEGWPAMVRFCSEPRLAAPAARKPHPAAARGRCFQAGRYGGLARPAGVALPPTRASPRSLRSRLSDAPAPFVDAQWAFYYCVSKLCGLTNPLVDDFPATSEVRRSRRSPALRCSNASCPGRLAGQGAWGALVRLGTAACSGARLTLCARRSWTW